MRRRRISSSSSAPESRFKRPGGMTKPPRGFEAAAELAPEYGGPDAPHRYLSVLYAEAEDLEAARGSLRRHLSRFPAAYEDWLRLAAMYSGAEEAPEAHRALQSAIEAYPMLPEPHERLAEAAERQSLPDLEVRERLAALASGAPDRGRRALFAGCCALPCGRARDGPAPGPRGPGNRPPPSTPPCGFC